jgi:hypothetical protein
MGVDFRKVPFGGDAVIVERVTAAGCDVRRCRTSMDVLAATVRKREVIQKEIDSSSRAFYASRRGQWAVVYVFDSETWSRHGRGMELFESLPPNTELYVIHASDRKFRKKLTEAIDVGR